MTRVLKYPYAQSTLPRKSHQTKRYSSPLLWIFFILIPTARSPLLAENRQEERLELQINLIIRQLGSRLGITQQIVLSLAPGNLRLASVECASRENNIYRISFAPEFLLTLEDREIRAAVAHELGHVWIFTHFPYLQTETLANKQALKLVSRSDLGRVYEKVWNWNGTKGSLEDVLGPVNELDTSGETLSEHH